MEDRAGQAAETVVVFERRAAKVWSRLAMHTVEMSIIPERYDLFSSLL